MKIERKQKGRPVKVEDVKPGDVFEFDNMLWIRLHAGGKKNGSVEADVAMTHCAELTQGMIKLIYDDTLVRPIECVVKEVGDA